MAGARVGIPYYIQQHVALDAHEQPKDVEHRQRRAALAEAARVEVDRVGVALGIALLPRADVGEPDIAGGVRGVGDGERRRHRLACAVQLAQRLEVRRPQIACAQPHAGAQIGGLHKHMHTRTNVHWSSFT